MFFTTFAYPYMNGPLHLGHLYTMLKAYFGANYHHLQTNSQVFFPIGFHCTGMPIYANAMKLKNDDMQVRQILLDSDAPEDQIEEFKDPVKWIEYFPSQAAETLASLKLKWFDPKTHFITTERNSYYDSFIRWQINTLKNQERIIFADRPCIYSEIDQQPCAAHDRQTGENAEVVKCQLKIVDGVWITHPINAVQDYPNLVTKGNYAKANHIDDYVYRCWQAQGKPDDMIVYLPSEPVISRSGDFCIVAKTGQWYLNYEDPVWKLQVIDYIEKHLIVHDPEVKAQLLSAANRQWNWCISREYGLGTQIPWDPKFKVDSLSDSTLYWAYYTVVQYLHSDIFGDVPGLSGITSDQLSHDFWDYIFMISDQLPSKISPEILEPLRKSFTDKMPMNLRVSGKDLINNHLVMAIFNGIAFGNNFLPMEYQVGGYLKLNNQKMSKSTGNFLTIKKALTIYNRDALLMSLAEAGDNTNDANLKLDEIKKTSMALDQTFKDLSKIRNVSSIKYNEFELRVYQAVIIECCKWMSNAYNRGRFREGISYGWRKMYKYYRQFSGTDQTLDNWARSVILTSLYVILPEHDIFNQVNLLQLINDIDTISKLDHDTQAEKLYNFRSLLRNEYNVVKNKGKVISCVTIHNNILKENESIIKQFLDEISTEIKVISDNTPIHEKRDPYKIKPKFTS